MGLFFSIVLSGLSEKDGGKHDNSERCRIGCRSPPIKGFSENSASYWMHSNRLVDIHIYIYMYTHNMVIEHSDVQLNDVGHYLELHEM